MKKILVIAFSLILSSGSGVLARAEEAGAGNRQVSPSGYQVQQAQQLQNQGEEQNLRVENNLEMQVGEKTEASGPARLTLEDGSARVREKSNDVAAKVQELLMERDYKGGIGERVKVIAQNQLKAQEKIAGDLAELEERPGWQRFFFGLKQKSVEEVETVLADNEERIAELTALLEDPSLTVADQAALEEGLLELKSQQSLIENHIDNAEDEFSVFGFFRNLFRRR